MIDGAPGHGQVGGTGHEGGGATKETGPSEVGGVGSDGEQYGRREYWEARYKVGIVGHTEEVGKLSNEWYLPYSVLGEVLARHISKDHSILLLGCGLSTLGEDMARDSYMDLTAIDYSSSCIERMRNVAAESGSRVTYEVMDVTKLRFTDGTLDCVLDKATLDALMCVDEEEDDTVQQMLDEAWRVLKPGGRFLCISNINCLSVLLADDESGTSHRRWSLEAEEKLRDPRKRQKFWFGVMVKDW